MDVGSAHETMTDTALAAGLRAIPTRRLGPEFAAELATVARRRWWVTYCALTVGSWDCVGFTAWHVVRVARILACADGDAVLERVARFVATGRVLDA